jgi:hypothetical protein
MLHGDIKVNNVVVGEWTAVRKSHDLRDFNDYHCTMEYRNMQGRLMEAEWDLRGQSVVNGAAGLAARVLSEGIARLKEKPMRTEDLMAEYLQ